MLANIIQRSLVAVALAGFFAIAASAQSTPAPQQPDTQSSAADVQHGQTNPSNGSANSNPSGASIDRKTVRHDRAQVVAARNQLMADLKTYGAHSPQVKQDHANLRAMRATLQTDRSELLHDGTPQ